MYLCSWQCEYNTNIICMSIVHLYSLLFQALNVTVTLLPAGHCPGSVMYVA